jgi:hypothetical protein
MESLNEERRKNKKLEERIAVVQESKHDQVFLSQLETLESTNILLRELNLTLSDKLL